ncbi:hypothetical protein [Microlunatus sp. Y2014]|uniref:hypothetical protein n=1 Tax=Microlunatus sp. Y2014 TaxID=3418488 RepID=UPI003DA789C2
MGATIEPVGSPLVGHNIRTACFGHLPDRTPVATLPTFGEPAKLNLVNAETGALIGVHPLPHKTTAYYSGIAPDGTAYVAGQTPGANLYRLDATSTTLRDLGPPLDGETHLTRLTAFAPDGTLYTGTFPRGHVVSYDPRADAFTDLGPVAEVEQYARSTATDGSTLWVGTGTHARLFARDLATGDTVEAELPPPYAGTQNFVNDLHVRDGILFAYLAPAHAWAVYDTRSRTWRAPLTDISDTIITEAVAGVVYYVAQDANLHAYELATGATTTVLDNGLLGRNEDQGIGVLQLLDPNGPAAPSSAPPSTDGCGTSAPRPGGSGSSGPERRVVRSRSPPWVSDPTVSCTPPAS